ncbi:hypothetical protein A3B35_02125 [Candidatus Kaiserbacteria bacterium RIFCSPLOWO2_01_FULL_54_24]|nr:MAG: hypothetical protein A3B35_02125 [Candidatus Kaiserbacteria bacterium RIFCSPLOWO2_01_FULL_54_24]
MKKVWPDFSPVVVGVIFRKNANGTTSILTQKRVVKIFPGEDPPYDPLYHDTYEAMGEKLNPGESVIDALIRGVKEECGKPDFVPKLIIGAEDKTVWTTGREYAGEKDNVVCCDPFCFLQSMGPPQKWLGPAFLVEVSADFDPDLSKSDGEASGVRWWKPNELRVAINCNQSQFMGLHMPALYKAAVYLANK